MADGLTHLKSHVVAANCIDFLGTTLKMMRLAPWANLLRERFSRNFHPNARGMWRGFLLFRAALDFWGRKKKGRRSGLRGPTTRPR